MGSYDKVRQYCGLQPLPETFDGPARPQEFSFDSWERFKTVYQFPSDIELFPGGLSEIPTEPGKLGPTFACVVAKQFQDLKFGHFWPKLDRIWSFCFFSKILYD